MQHAIDIERLQELRRQSIRVSINRMSSSGIRLTSSTVAVSAITVIPVAVSTTAALHNTTKAVAFSVEVLRKTQWESEELNFKKVSKTTHQ